MKECKIVLAKVDTDDGSTGIEAEVRLIHANMLDKFNLMHSLASALHLDKDDIKMYSLGEVAGIFEKNSTKIEIPIKEE